MHLLWRQAASRWVASGLAGIDKHQPWLRTAKRQHHVEKSRSNAPSRSNTLSRSSAEQIAVDTRPAKKGRFVTLGAKRGVNWTRSRKPANCGAPVFGGVWSCG